MLMKQLLLILIITIFVGSTKGIEAKDNYFLDAVVFGSDSTEGKIDVFIVIPYQLLTFEKYGNKFVSKIDIDLMITDENGNRIDYEHKKKTITSSNYRQSQGADGEYYKAFFRFYVNNGKYNVVSDIKDEFSGKNYKREREVTVIDFRKYNLSLSGILLLSQIEEIDNRYKITPFISDNIGAINSDFFAFFEIYNNSNQKKIELGFRLLQGDEIILEGELKEKLLVAGVNQGFLRVDASKLNLSGEYLLQVIAYDSGTEKQNIDKAIAITQRSIKHRETLVSFLEADVNKAIKMLRYIATDDEIDKMMKLKSEDLKREKLSLFWKELDPTPNTVYNEAMNEYYQRIKYANEQFKSYTEGWLTDMGMVYVVLGPPNQVERQSSMGNNIEYRLWQYSNNRTFLFADKNGFGNFRLERPYLFNEKYRYRK